MKPVSLNMIWRVWVPEARVVTLRLTRSRLLAARIGWLMPAATTEKLPPWGDVSGGEKAENETAPVLAVQPPPVVEHRIGSPPSTENESVGTA